MSDQFLKFTVNNSKQQEALQQIIAKGSNISGGFMFESGTDLSIFQGDVNDFSKAFMGITDYSAEQSAKIFGAVDQNGDGKLDTNEIRAFASLGDGEWIDNADIRLDETDITALMDIARENVEAALVEDIDDVNVNNNSNVTNVPEEVPTEVPVQKAEPTTAAERSTISDNDALARAAELRTAMAGWGTDEATVSRILEESGYSSADILKIMDTFENQYGETLMKDIQGDFSGSEETMHREMLYSAAAEEARQTLGWSSTEDIPDDIAQKANEFYKELESADATGYMKNFDKLSESEKAQIMVACDMLHPDELAISRITEDRAWFGKEDGYVDRIISALKDTAYSEDAKAANAASQSAAVSSEQTTTSSTMSDVDAASKAAELRTAMAGWGTDEKTVSRVLLESGYSSEDIVKIMNTFEDQYGESLMSDIQDDYSGNQETVLRETLYSAAEQEALKQLGWTSTDDIPSSIVQQANEFYQQLNSADATGYMKNFDKLSDSDKAQIMIACDLLHGTDGKTAMSRITQGRAWFGKEDGYVDGIISALRKTANGEA